MDNLPARPDWFARVLAAIGAIGTLVRVAEALGDRARLQVRSDLIKWADQEGHGFLRLTALNRGRRSVALDGVWCSWHAHTMGAVRKMKDALLPTKGIASFREPVTLGEHQSISFLISDGMGPLAKAGGGYKPAHTLGIQTAVGKRYRPRGVRRQLKRLRASRTRLNTAERLRSFVHRHNEAALTDDPWIGGGMRVETDLPSKRASLTARIDDPNEIEEVVGVEQPSGTSWVSLVIENGGPAEARNINVEIGGESRFALGSMTETRLPIVVLGSGESLELALLVVRSIEPEMVQVTIRFEDGTGQREEVVWCYAK